MKKDLAPKFMYYLGMVVWGMCSLTLIIFLILLLNAPNKDELLFPILWILMMILVSVLLFIFLYRKTIFLIIDPLNDRGFIAGNFFLGKSRYQDDQLQIVKKVWINLYKVRIEGATRFIQTNDRSIDEFIKDRAIFRQDS